MAKRKNLLLTESTTMRMMGLAGIGSLANPFLKESDLGGGRHPDGDDPDGDVDMVAEGDYMDEDLYEGEELEEMDDLMDEDSYLEEDEDLEEAKEKGKEKCPHCHKIHEGSCGAMKESIRRSMSKLKRLLEQAEADAPPPPPPPAAAAEPPPAMEGGDEMETKIKEFVKKLGELVQETLGVEVKVEEEGEEEMEPAEGGEGEEPAGASPPPPAALQEAIDRLVNKVARRVKARLMEAKKDPKTAAKAKKMMKEKQMAAKKKEMEAAKKKKEMMMKKKKAAMMKKK